MNSNTAQPAPQTGSVHDVAIVGGGLAGGLIALAIAKARPAFRLCLIETGERLGGNHRWSWFESDLSSEGAALLEPFRKTAWDDGYDVMFPGYGRTLATGYRSLSSDDFHAALVRLLPEGTIRLGCRAEALDANGVDVAERTGGRHRIAARAVIDCRAFEPSPHLAGGWQVFLGRHVRFDQPHDVARPVIMDARVPQLAPHGNGGAYRFVYSLPLGARDLFVEDTYYADAPLLDRGALSARIDQYLNARGQDGGTPVGREAGVLPVIAGGRFDAYRRAVAIEGVAIAGARGGFMHPLTSYTLPIAVENALAIAAEADLTGPQLAALVETRARAHWRRTAFYRRLARMLFHAAEPEHRVRIFARFYRLDTRLVERFYAGRSTVLDRLRILSGRPPVRIARALSALLGRSRPLADINANKETA